MSTVKQVLVEVLAPFKVSLGGQSWRAGEIAEVDEVTAGNWLRYGYVRLVELPPEPEPAKAKRPPKQPEPEQPDEPSSEG